MTLPEDIEENELSQKSILWLLEIFLIRQIVFFLFKSQLYMKACFYRIVLSDEIMIVLSDWLDSQSD